METKDLSLDLAVLKADEATGIIEGIANVGNIRDLQGDTMAPGCWGKAIREGQRPAICVGHDTKTIVGITTYLEEMAPGDRRIAQNQKGGSLATGLYFKAQMAMKTQGGRETFELFKGGFFSRLSAQFTVSPNGEEPDGKGGRIVKEVDTLYEISAVLAAASPGSRVLVAKEDTSVEPTEDPVQTYVTAKTVFAMSLAYALGYLQGRKNTEEGKPNA